ncbi:hypothetical protein BFR62_10105 [Acinetobacter pittii]|nr:hypothetical protein BFR62_10105 [Acinetobacter pittii]
MSPILIVISKNLSVGALGFLLLWKFKYFQCVSPPAVFPHTSIKKPPEGGPFILFAVKRI